MRGIAHDHPAKLAGYNQALGTSKVSKPRQRVQLGYVLKLPIKPNPTAALPEKYRRKTKDATGMEFGPPEQVLYEGHIIHAEGW
jgi:hypothetical protein